MRFGLGETEKDHRTNKENPEFLGTSKPRAGPLEPIKQIYQVHVTIPGSADQEPVEDLDR
jgi:hypothetical protein